MKLNVDELKFERCDEEPIHRPELIQSYGYLFALNSDDWKIAIVSANVEWLLGENKTLIDQPFFSFLQHSEDIEFLIETYYNSKRAQSRLPVSIRFKPELLKNDHSDDFFAVVYSSDNYFVIEIEPSPRFRETYTALHRMRLYATSVAPKFKRFKTLNEMSEEMVSTIRYITGMDRVVLYRFLNDGTGQVLAESKIPEAESYLGLLYPADDIPIQARKLYTKNWIRLLANVDLEPTPLIPTVEESGRKPLDMTFSLLRDISPIHKQYVRNQGLSSSLSMSLVTHGELWGMISCHSKTPRYIPQNVRLECENLSQLFSWHLYAKEEELTIRRTKHIDNAILGILDQIAPNKSIVEIFEANQAQILEILKADGFMFFTDTEEIRSGTVPHLSVAKEIYEKYFNIKSPAFYTEKLIDYIPEKGRLNGISGMLMMSIGGNSKYFTAWFRKEHVQIQKWAGLPNEKSPSASKAQRLNPRESFAIHKIKIRNNSKRWDSQDVDVASRFNKVFMAYAFEKQEMLRSDIKYLQLQNKYVNEFLATLAHELRNPLAPIATGLSLLEEVDDKKLRQEFMSTMKRQVDHMTTMIDDLMDVSRITQNKVKIEKHTLNLCDILTEAVTSCKTFIDRKKHKLTTDIPDQPIWICGDKTRLNQVFVNILNNAAKYTDSGGEISLSAALENGMAKVLISDNGLGLEKKQLDTIFTMFTQMNALSSESKSGLGIGLTLVKRLLELHNSEVKAYSEGLGSGSTFEVLIPLTSSQNGKSELEIMNIEEKPNESKLAERILIVDDNEALAFMLQILLKKKNYQVAIAFDGESAMKEFADNIPHFVILDLGLPDIDGFELLNKLKSIKGAKKTIYFSHSGLGNKDKIERSAQLGFSEHFIKPVRTEVLLEALSKYSQQ